MISIVIGDLTTFPEGINAVLHVANCQNKMGAGVALSLKDKYPEVFEADTKIHEEEGKPVLGRYSIANLPKSKYTHLHADCKVINLYAQDRYGRETRHLDYEALYTGFESIRKGIEAGIVAGRSYKLGIPYKLGCNNAGGDWKVVSAMIESVFASATFDVAIVVLEELRWVALGETSAKMVEDKKVIEAPKIESAPIVEATSENNL